MKLTIIKFNISYTMYQLFVFLFFLLIGENLVAQELICQPGDSLSVVAKSGLNLRENPNANSKIIDKISFGKKVVVLSITQNYELIENRPGRWLEVSHGNKTGYLFSGYLSKISFLDLEQQKFHCIGHYTFSNWLESTTKGTQIIDQREFPKAGYSLDGKDGNLITWKFHEDGTMIYHSFGYESEDYTFETFNLSMNDFLNYLEYYLTVFENKCSEVEYYTLPKLKITKTSYNSIQKIESVEMGNLKIVKHG